MSQGEYAVVFKGEFIEGFDPEQVKAKLAEVFNLTAERLDALFSMPRVVLKRNLSEAEASKFQRFFDQTGITTYLERSGQDSSVEGVPPAGDSTAAPARDEGAGRILPFRFLGSGGEFFRIWIVNLVLTILTLGIYSAWAKVRTQRYFHGNTELAASRFDYLATPIMILKGRLIAFGLLLIYLAVDAFYPLFSPVLVILFFLLMPWLIVRSLMFRAKMTAYRGVRFGFSGKVGEAFVVLILLPIGAVLTLGLLFPYVVYRQQRFLAANSLFGTSRFAFNAVSTRYYGIFFAAFGIMLAGIVLSVPFGSVAEPLKVLPLLVAYLIAFVYVKVMVHNLLFNSTKLETHGFRSRYGLGSYAMLHLTNTLGMILTLGLFYPWAKVRTARYAAEHTDFDAVGDLDRFVAARQARVSATGEEIGDLFDVEFGF